MATKPKQNYSISPAKIGNQDGFRLPRAFSRDYPHLVTASGYMEVLDDNTLLVRLEPNETSEGDDSESVTMSLFLDILMKQVIQEPSFLVPYTKEPSEFIAHPTVKLFKAIDIGIKEKIPLDPFASHFVQMSNRRLFE